MKIELPPPIPSKRASPRKVEHPPRDEVSPAERPLPVVPPRPQASPPPITPAPSNEKAGKPAEIRESGKRPDRIITLLAWLVWGAIGFGVLVFVLGLFIIAVTSPNQTPTADTNASQIAASSPQSSPATSGSVEAASPPKAYHVIKVKEGHSLNLRTGPDQASPVVTTLVRGTRGILLLPERSPNGSTMWQKISVNGYIGWVNEEYLEADPPE